MRPIAGRRRKAMMHGIDVNIIEVLCEIVLVTNGVFPEAALPNALFPFCAATLALKGRPICPDVGTRESLFDQAPSCGEIEIPFRQDPDCVQVVRKNDIGVQLEGMTGTDLLNSLQKECNYWR